MSSVEASGNTFSSIHAEKNRSLIVWLGNIALLSTIFFLAGQIIFLCLSNGPKELFFVGGWLSAILTLGMFLSIIACVFLSKTVTWLLFGTALTGIITLNIFTYTFVLKIEGTFFPFLYYPIFPLYPGKAGFVYGTSWAIISLCMLIGGIAFLRQKPLRWGNFLPFGIGVAFLAILYSEWAFQIAHFIPTPMYVKFNAANIIALAPFLILNALLSLALIQSSRKKRG